MKVVSIKGDYDSMRVTLEDGRKAEFGGDLVCDGFVAFENSARKWLIPEGEPISDSERAELVEAVLEKAKENPKMKITFETYRKPTEEEKEASWKEFLERVKKA